MEIKKRIAPKLRTMEVGETETFPIWYLNTVRVTVSRLQLAEGLKYSTATNKGGGYMSVTRIR